MIDKAHLFLTIVEAGMASVKVGPLVRAILPCYIGMEGGSHTLREQARLKAIEGHSLTPSGLPPKVPNSRNHQHLSLGAKSLPLTEGHLQTTAGLRPVSPPSLSSQGEERTSGFMPRATSGEAGECDHFT